MYIGEKKVQSTFEKEDGKKLQVSFEDDNPDIIITKQLFNNIVTENQGQGGITDTINHYFATKFLYELAEEEFEYYMVENIAMSMRTLAHNMREDLLRKTFNCSGGDAINLKTLIDNIYGGEEQSEGESEEGEEEQDSK